MRIARMTIVLPARLRHVAEPEARRIAEATATQLALGGHRGGDIRVELSGNGLSGHSLAAVTARSVAGVGGRAD